MIWEYFVYFAIASILLWIIGAVSSWKRRAGVAYASTLAGILVFFVYIVVMWIALDRPPLRTMGETRLWYSLFLPVAGIIVYSRWHYRWILSFSTLMATVFVCINLFKPEIHTKTLMPALQSPWFAPHVIVYMIAYALLGAATLVAVYHLFFAKQPSTQDDRIAEENLVNSGFAFLTLGMLMGALWAKEAWGHYWSWDPKETWAAVTWLAYLVYIHLTRYDNKHIKLAHWILVINFCLLQMCWWGINYLPSAQMSSVHTYSMQ